jgi:hypothetical protein
MRELAELLPIAFRGEEALSSAPTLAPSFPRVALAGTPGSRQCAWSRIMFSRRRKSLFDRMLKAVELIKLGIFVRLQVRYLAEYGECSASLLAAAVTNELFSACPTTPEAEKFLELNMDLVKVALANLKEDAEVRQATTRALRVKAFIEMDGSAKISPRSIAPLERIQELGILVPGGDTPTPDSFLEYASWFYETNTKLT